jgi:predicted nucleic acid-binding protein
LPEGPQLPVVPISPLAVRHRSRHRQNHVRSTTLRLVDQRRLNVYDAVYLELAEPWRLPLAALDEALRTAARAGSVALRGVAP